MGAHKTVPYSFGLCAEPTGKKKTIQHAKKNMRAPFPSFNLHQPFRTDSLALDFADSLPLVANESQHLGPEAHGGFRELGLVAVNGRALPDEISLMGLNEAGALNKLPANEENGSEDLHGVGLEEADDVEWLNIRVAIEDEDENLDDDGNVGAIRLESSVVGQRSAVEALGLAGSMVEDECDGHGDEVDDTTTSDESSEPGDDLGRVAADGAQREEGEEHDNHEAVDGDTTAVALAEEARSTTIEGKTVERAGGAVGVGVTSREDGSHHQSVDNVGEHGDLESVHGHDIGRGGSAGALAAVEVDPDESIVVVRKYDADAERTTEEEEAEAPVDRLEGSLDVDTGALGLGSDHGDVFGTDNCEGSAPESAEETLETALVAGASVLGKGTGGLPVAEAVDIVSGVAADHGDEGEEEEHEEQNDLAARQPEFGLTITADGEEVQGTVAGNDTDADTSSRAGGRDLVAPVGDDEGQGGNLKGNEKSLVEEKIPTRHETKSVVDKVSGKTNEATRHGVQRGHFGNGVVDKSEDTRIDDEDNEQTARATLGETSTDTDEEGSTNGATNGNQLDLTVVEAAMQAVGIVSNVKVVHVRGRARHLHLGVFFIVGDPHGCESAAKGLGVRSEVREVVV